MKKLLAVLLVLVLAGGLVGAMAQGDADVIKVKIGVVSTNNDQWHDYVIPTLALEGIEVELVQFSDYIVPNIALADGEIDLNAFQHHNFLNKWVSENGRELVAIGNTFIAPLCIYSNKIESLDELKEGDGIAIMNDAVNEARALRVLEDAGLIKLDENSTELATLIDIVENPLNLNIIEVEAAMTFSMMNDPTVTAAFINVDHATNAGLLIEDSIYREKYDADNEAMKGIVNIIAARAEDAENEVYKRVVEVYQTDEVADILLTKYKGSFIPAW